jgi:hypothetical protein
MIYVSSREEAIIFQQKEIERLQAERIQAEQKAAEARQMADELRGFVVAPNAPRMSVVESEKKAA